MIDILGSEFEGLNLVSSIFIIYLEDLHLNDLAITL